MFKVAMKDVTSAVEAVLRTSARTATVFVKSRKRVLGRVRATRVKKNKETIVLSIGKPNHAEREYIKLCAKAKALPQRLWLKYDKKK